MCGRGVGTSSAQLTKCNGWFHRRRSGARDSSLYALENSFMCAVCETTDSGNESSLDVLDLEKGAHMENVRSFFHLGGGVFNGGRGANSTSLSTVRGAWANFRSCWYSDEDRKASETESKGVHHLCEKHNVWKNLSGRR